jgi:CRP-like cAMP-binding protein
MILRDSYVGRRDRTSRQEKHTRAEGFIPVTFITAWECQEGIMRADMTVVSKIAYFAALGKEELEHVAAMTVVRRYERGDIILLEGDKGGALCYVHTGLVKVFKTSPEGKEQVLRLIAAGHTFNDVPALDGGPNPASAAAMEASELYLIRHRELRTPITTRPEVAVAVVQSLAEALRHLVALVEDLSLRYVTARVAKMLLDQEQEYQSVASSHHLTQQEMAAMAGTAREVVGPLKELEAAGAIEIHQGRAVVINHERLAMLT